ncbi:MAG: glycosyltransferase [Balneolales bacterium]|nr:glycosyltransferase [Balneolales bacterium]
MTQHGKSITPDISIVIVNYNVKEYLANLLHSVYRARHRYQLEIFVVDNYSTDGSIEFLKERFPDVHYIVNTNNEGFGKANNQAITQCSGKYTLIVNPDVLIGEDTFDVLYKHMESRPQTAACGCKILNPDGTFAPESRRSIPTPANALYKVLGLTALFPNSKQFASYYMGGKDENTASEVEVLSGSFMFYRTDILKELEGFDERFFMYGEDIDLCFRTLKMGYKIDYVPSTSIIHYKGESTKKGNLKYIITFNKALYQFFEKHYSYGYGLAFRLTILLGIVLKAIFSYIAALFQKTYQPLADIIILNVSTVLFFLLRYSIHPLDVFGSYRPSFLIINLLFTGSFLLYAKYYDLYSPFGYSFPKLFKSLMFSLITVVFVTFFLRDFAFSRLIIIASAASALIILPLYRYMLAGISRKRNNALKRPSGIRLLIAGIDENTEQAIRKIRSEVEWNYTITGLISQNVDESLRQVEQVPVLGHISQLPDFVSAYKIDQVIFILDKVRHIDVLKSLTLLRNANVVCKVVPDSLDYIIGKSNVEYFDDVPVVGFELPSLNAWNRLVKRSFDLFASLFLLIVLAPAFFINKFLSSGGIKQSHQVNIFVDSSTSVNFRVLIPARNNRFLNFYRFLIRIFTGDFSFVGAPVISGRQGRFVYYKPGLTGLRQINEGRLFREEEKERYELHYLQTYTIWKDLEILLHTITRKTPFYTDYIQSD